MANETTSKVVCNAYSNKAKESGKDFIKLSFKGLNGTDLRKQVADAIMSGNEIMLFKRKDSGEVGESGGRKPDYVVMAMPPRDAAATVAAPTP